MCIIKYELARENEELWIIMIMMISIKVLKMYRKTCLLSIADLLVIIKYEHFSSSCIKKSDVPTEKIIDFLWRSSKYILIYLLHNSMIAF